MASVTPPYIGRFAPSPTGPLHAGSLLAAVASYLDAKAHQGQWLLRIEDVDRLRTVSGATDSILSTLEAHGLHWDGTVSYQTHNDGRYQAALNQLARQQQVFYCDCTRAALRQHGPAYPGFCRTRKSANYINATRHQPASHAIRFEVGDTPVGFIDRILGSQDFSLAALSDFILRRRDSLFAYQLAVVVDDAEQGINNIVRGADLLPSTPWQIALQQALNLPQPQYAHLPLLIHADGKKLSKQTGARAVDDNQAGYNLCQVLMQLGQPIPKQGQQLPVAELLQWAITHWQIKAVPNTNIAANTSTHANTNANSNVTSR